MNWFQEEFSFNESDVKEVKAIERVNLIDKEFNIFQIKKNLYYAGKFECLSLNSLTSILEDIKKDPNIHRIKDFCYPFDDYQFIKEENSKEKEIKKILKNLEEEEFKCPNVTINNMNEKNSGSDLEFLSELKKGLVFTNLSNMNVKTLICQEKNNGAVFQVASQFNCLEMVGPSVRPEDGITIYNLDKTQGPECALSCRSALFFRNYLINGKGQLGNNQIDLLDELDIYLENTKDNKKQFWEMRNGYFLTFDHLKVLTLKERFEKEKNLSEEMKKKVKIGIHWDTEVNLKKVNKSKISQQRICQVFCSTIAFSYEKNKKDQKKKWDPFCPNLLDAVYDATLTAGAILANLKQERVKIFLTAIGGGVFGNPKKWIADAIKKSITKHKNEPLDVYLVSYSGIPEQFKTIKTPKN